MDNARRYALEQEHPLKNYVVIAKLMSLLDYFGKVNASFVCPEWANEARKYIHKQDEYGYVYLKNWLEHKGCHHTEVESIFARVDWPRLGPCISHIRIDRTLSVRTANTISRLLPGLTALSCWLNHYSEDCIPGRSGIVRIVGSDFADCYMGRIFDGTIIFTNVRKLNLTLIGPGDFMRTYPVPLSTYRITPDKEAQYAIQMIKAFPKLRILKIGRHVFPVLTVVIQNFEELGTLEEIRLYSVLAEESSLEILQQRYPLVLKSQLPIRLPITAFGFELYPCLDYLDDNVINMNVFFLNFILKEYSNTLIKLRLTGLTGTMGCRKMDVWFPNMPNLKLMELAQRPWNPPSYRFFTPQVQDKDPTIQFPLLTRLIFDGVQCYQSTQKCYNIDATLFMIQKLFPCITKPCKSVQVLPIFSDPYGHYPEFVYERSRILPPCGHLEDESSHLCQASQSTVASFKGKLLSRFPMLDEEWETHISNL